MYRQRSRAFTIIEVIVAASLLALLMLFVIGIMMNTQEQVVEGTALQTVNARARLATEKIANELRDLNFNDLDITPVEPQAAFTPTAGTPFTFRKTTGWDSVNNRPELTPDRPSTASSQLYLSGEEIVLVRDSAAGTSAVVLADKITSLTLDYSDLPAPAADDEGGTLTITVTAEQIIDNKGNTRTLRGSNSITLHLRNDSDDAS